MDLEERDDGGVGGGGGGVFPQLFYIEAGNEVDTGREGDANCQDPCERHMDRPGAAPGLF